MCAQPVSAELVNWGGPNTLEGSSVTIEGATGARCSSKNGSPIAMYGGGTSKEDGFSGGIVGIVIPLQNRSTGDCGKILRYEEAVVRMQVATRLLEQGIITPDQFRAIAEEVYSVIKPKG